MRSILKLRKYELGEDGVWRKDGSEHEIPDDRIEEEHFKVLIETMSAEALRAKASFMHTRLGRSRP